MNYDDLLALAIHAAAGEKYAGLWPDVCWVRFDQARAAIEETKP